MTPINATMAVLIFMASCVLIEMLYSHFFGKKLYSPGETYVNMACGILERLLDILIVVVLFGVFETIYKSGFTLFSIQKFSAWMIIPLLLITDLCWYWYHRMSHEINVLWAIHIVHHQSQDYNLSVFFRATGIQNMVRIIFWLPLAFVGFPPMYCALGIGILGIYQFFMHNQWIGRIKWMEPWFANPSHHRIHHSSNEKYLDKNYAGLFTFYDRWFGTYEVETEPCVYGVTNTFKRTNINSVYFGYFNSIIQAFKLNPNSKNWIQLLLDRPSKMPVNLQNNQVAEIRSSNKDTLLITVTILFNGALLYLILTYKMHDLIEFGIAMVMVINLLLIGQYLEANKPKNTDSKTG